MEQRASIRDVAAHAGVSPSTVSRVLNGHDADHMRPETKERILASIKELDYTPVRAAQRLRRRRTQAFGVLIPDISNLYFSLLTRGVESVAFDEGYSTLVCDSNHEASRESAYLDFLLSEGVDGIVFVPVGRPDLDLVHHLIERGVRVLVADRRIDGLTTVDADNVGGSRDLTAHLLGLGYRAIAYIAGPAEVSTAEDRLAGFRRAMKAAGRSPVAVVRGSFTFPSGYDHAAAILDRHSVDAIIAANDLMAVGAIRAAEDRGLAVPDDLGVAGFDHVPWAALVRPQLTTVEVPAYAIGREAGRRLLDGNEESLRLPTTLIPGGTCMRRRRTK
ncbi:MAG: LacI family DNA-binding transcriptional regulator [Candidatus Bipolaricaulia bacterium]